jgi:hypothetical protein
MSSRICLILPTAGAGSARNSSDFVHYPDCSLGFYHMTLPASCRWPSLLGIDGDAPPDYTPKIRGGQKTHLLRKILQEYPDKSGTPDAPDNQGRFYLRCCAGNMMTAHRDGSLCRPEKLGWAPPDRGRLACELGISIYVVLAVPSFYAYGPIDKLCVFCYNVSN